MKRIVACLLTAAMLCGLLAGCGGGAPEATTPTEPSAESAAVKNYHEPAAAFAGGSGTQEDPYQISNAGELVLLEQKLREAADGFAQACYVLTGDISLNETTSFSTWGEEAPIYHWAPIGGAGDTFAGIFDGNGHTIQGIYLQDDTQEYNGLFAQSSGLIRNVKIDKSYLCAGGEAAGLLVGKLKLEGRVEGCSVSGILIASGADNAGGIVGQDGVVVNSEFSGTALQRDEGFTNLGGIIGYGGQVINCTNYGSVSGTGYAGGISGWGDVINGCVNKGIVVGDTAGGICGNMYEAGMGIQPEHPQIGITDCVNEGQVNGTTVAGGIIGKLGNDETDVTVSLSGCENRGQIQCDEAVGGIIGKLMVERTGEMTIENCVNHEGLTGKGTVGGIICELDGGIMNQTGTVTVSGCRNEGAITGLGDYAAGIVTYFLLMGSKTDLRLTLENCENAASITAQKYAGGIMSFSSSLLGGNLEISEDSSITLKGCHNSGDVTTLTSNSYAGGIAGNFSAEGIHALFEDCHNTGAVSIQLSLTEEQIQATLADGVQLTLSQMVGGIIGRLGEGALSFTDLDEGDASNVQKEDAWIRLRNCSSTGNLSATDYSRYKIGDHQVWVSFIGGLIGSTCAEDLYSCHAENCTYTGTARGLGNPEYLDLGTKQ